MNLSLSEKILEAKKALQKKRVFFGGNISLAEFFSLKINDTNEVCCLIRELLEEIAPQHFVAGSKMLEFVWKSKKLNKKMNIGFAVKNDWFYYLFLRDC